MQTKIIDGKKIAERIKDEIVSEVVSLGCAQDYEKARPHLAIVLAGDRKDSEIYVNLKEREAKRVGIDTSLYKFDESASQADIEETIKFLNKDSAVHGILLQLPLPEKFDTDKLIEAIDPDKDVDRFHPQNIKSLSGGCSDDDVVPPLIQVVLEVFLEIKFEPRNKVICVIANSDILGQSFKEVLECRGASVVVVRANDKALSDKTRLSDVLISAVGQPGLITNDFIKEGTVLIDIGITKVNDKVYGDVDYESVKDVAGFLTPVPGGVGPITIAAALKNTLKLYKEKNCK